MPFLNIQLYTAIFLGRIVYQVSSKTIRSPAQDFFPIAWASALSDQSICMLSATSVNSQTMAKTKLTQCCLGICPVWSLATQWALSEDFESSLGAHSLLWVFAGHTFHFVDFVMLRFTKWLIFRWHIRSFNGQSRCAFGYPMGKWRTEYGSLRPCNICSQLPQSYWETRWWVARGNKRCSDIW